MPATEGQTSGISVIALDKNGAAAASARTADTLFVAWFFGNQSSSHDMILRFTRARLFQLRLIDAGGNQLWESDVPPDAADYEVIVQAGGRFSLPLNPIPPEVPPQVPTIPLQKIIADHQIAADVEIDLHLTVPLVGGEITSQVRLWR